MVMTFHTRSTLISFGAGALIPTVQSLAFFVEIGPLVAALLLAGRAGSGIGAVLANTIASLPQKPAQLPSDGTALFATRRAEGDCAMPRWGLTPRS
jgi:hypothetical protein